MPRKNCKAQKELFVEDSAGVMSPSDDISVAVFLHEIAITFVVLEGAFEAHSIGCFHNAGAVLLALTEVAAELSAILLP